jgi:hypothetical protein
MREITVQIPEEKLALFIELMGEMGFTYDLNTEIPLEHQIEVLDRIKNSKRENAIPIDTFFENLNEKLKQKTV